MAIELVQRIENNQRMHLGFTLLVFAFALVITSAPQIATTFFAIQTQNLNEQLIDRLTANFAQLLKLLAQTTPLVTKQNQEKKQSDDDKSNEKEN
ncbi:hypothetical protein G9A89_013920 [Geosiphon pyriformis]|nr:hypothetical protein G9A89_013920 [Geosiphon pyriformis]